MCFWRWQLSLQEQESRPQARPTQWALAHRMQSSALSYAAGHCAHCPGAVLTSGQGLKKTKPPALSGKQAVCSTSAPNSNFHGCSSKLFAWPQVSAIDAILRCCHAAVQGLLWSQQCQGQSGMQQTLALPELKAHAL